MKNKGFAITTMIYASIVLFAIIIFTVLAIIEAQYSDQKEFVEQINRNLTSSINK